MCNVFCVTCRSLCREPFLERIEKIAAAHPAGIILREKDLPQPAYKALAAQVMDICRRQDVPCILHSYIGAALELHGEAVHVPMHILRSMTQEQKSRFSRIGASCHSIRDALEAQKLGCTYISAGHIFATDCKKGLPGRGLVFLRQVCGAVSIPVYAIGGINETNIQQAGQAGAEGVCLMSSLMRCPDAGEFLRNIHLRNVHQRI